MHKRIVTGIAIALVVVASFYGYKMRCSGPESLPIPLPVDFKQVMRLNNLMPVVIIGSGPAGSTAAYYIGRGMIDVLVIEGPKPGGQLTETGEVENWPGVQKIRGADIPAHIKTQAEAFGAQYYVDTVQKVDFAHWPFTLWTENGQEIRAMAVIVATGSYPLRLGVAGEEAYWAKGVSSCAVCDAAFYKNKRVIVVGGGDSAIEEALILARYAQSVTILVRSGAMRAAARNQNYLREYPNINVSYNKEITEILGDEYQVTSVKIKNKVSDQIECQPIDGIFLAVGHKPNSELFAPFLPTNASGYLQTVGKTQQTVIPGIFVAGDVADNRYRQAVKAAGDGGAAGLDAVAYLQAIGYSTDVAAMLKNNFFNVVRAQIGAVAQIETVAQFESDVIASPVPVIIDFYGDDCVTCKAITPMFESVAQDFQGRVSFLKVNADKAIDLISDPRVRVMKVPSFLVFSKGQLRARYYPETISRSEMVAFVEQFLK